MLKDTLKEYRTQRGFSQTQLAERVGVTRQAISQWETGTAVPSIEKLQALSSVLDVPMDLLAGEEPPTPRPDGIRVLKLSVSRPVRVPLLSREVTSCCGAGIPTYSEIQNPPEKTYTYTISDLGGRYDQMRPPVAIYAEGACLERARIQDGDILVINPALEPRHLQICVVCWRGVLSAKRVSINPDGSVDLRSDYDTYHIDAEEAADPDRFIIWGPVVEVRHGLL